MSADTSAEAVERLAQRHDELMPMGSRTAATLRALAAERDAMRAELDGRVNSVAQNIDAQLQATLADRDRLAADVARLRTALKNAGEFLGEEGFFRRCEDVELFLAGGKAAWLEDAGDTP
jgi:hypothetical protein